MKKVPRPSGHLITPRYQQDRLRIQACYTVQRRHRVQAEQRNIQHSCFEPSLSILHGGEKKLGEQVNKLLYQESDLLDIGLVMQKKTKKHSTVGLY